MVADDQHLHGEHAVEERAEDRVDENTRVVALEAEDEDAVERDRKRAEERDPSRPAVDRGDWTPTTVCGRKLSFPKIRAAVTIWIRAKKIAAVANHTLPAMAELNTEVTRSVYVELTLASIVPRQGSHYDRLMSTAASAGRRHLAPLVIAFVVVSGLVFVLAKAHLARPGLPKAVPGQKIQLGDFYNGQTIFSQKCAACHGTDGKGGPVGPKLDGPCDQPRRRESSDRQRRRDDAADARGRKAGGGCARLPGHDPQDVLISSISGPVRPSSRPRAAAGSHAAQSRSTSAR